MLLHYGFTYMDAVENEWKRVTGRNDFWEAMKERYGLEVPMDSSFNTNPYHFREAIRDYNLNMNNIKDELERNGFKYGEFFRTVHVRG